jgi:hypothetical protein
MAANWYVTTVVQPNLQSVPRQIASDQAGNLYFANSNNYVVSKLDTNYNLTTFAGSGTSGYQDGPGTTAEFGTTEGVAVDSSGYVYVCDNKDTIRRISPAGTVETVAGANGAAGNINGAGNYATVNNPFYLACSSSGSLLVGSFTPALRIIQPIQSSASPQSKTGSSTPSNSKR